MEFTASAFQLQCGEVGEKSASVPAMIDETSPRSMDTGEDDTSIVVITAADHRMKDGSSHYRLLDNHPFKLYTEEEERRHFRTDEFILKVDLAAALLSKFASRNIPKLQCLGLVTDLQELAKTLRRRSPIYKSVEGSTLNAPLDDAIWETQETLETLLQLLPKQQKHALINGPGWEQIMQKVIKWLSIGDRLPRLQKRLVSHVQVLKVQIAADSSSSSVQGTPLFTEHHAGPADPFTTATVDEDSKSMSTHSVPSLTTTVTQESSLSQHTSDGVSQQDPYVVSEILDPSFENVLPESSDFQEITPDLRRICSILQVLEDAACGPHDSGAETTRGSPPALLAGEIRLCGLCTGYVRDDLALDNGCGVVDPSDLNAIGRWLASRDDPWTVLRMTARRQCQLTQRFSRDPAADARRFYYFDPQTLRSKGGQITSEISESPLAYTPESSTQTKHGSVIALFEELNLHPDSTGQRTTVKITGFAGSAENSSDGTIGSHDSSNSSGNATGKKMGQFDKGAGRDHDRESGDKEDSGGKPPTSPLFKSNFAEYFQCIYRDDPPYRECFMPFADMRTLKRHLESLHKKSTQEMRVSKMRSPSEAEKWRALWRNLRPGEAVPSPHFSVCKCSNFQRSIGEANDLFFHESVWETGQTSQYGPGYFGGNDFRPASVPTECSQLPERVIEGQHNNQRFAANYILPSIVESSNHGISGTPFDVKEMCISETENFLSFDSRLPISSPVMADSMPDLHSKSAFSGMVNPLLGYNLGNMTGTADSPAFNRKDNPTFSTLPSNTMEAPFNGLLPAAPMSSLTSGLQLEQCGAYFTNSAKQRDCGAVPFDVNSLPPVAYLDSDMDSRSMLYDNSNPSQTTGVTSFQGWTGSERGLDYSTGFTGLCTSFQNEEAQSFQSYPNALQHSGIRKRH